MSLNKGENLILNLIQLDPGIGKTAVMKIMFMLQEVKGIKAGYDFSIYTYGPYAAEVMEDIDYLSSNGYITCSMYHSYTYIGYKLLIQELGKKAISPLNEKEATSLMDVIQFARNKTAKNLELYSTIIYFDRLIKKNGWEVSQEQLAKMVHDIKPHFSVDLICSSYLNLKNISYV